MNNVTSPWLMQAQAGQMSPLVPQFAQKPGRAPASPVDPQAVVNDPIPPMLKAPVIPGGDRPSATQAGSLNATLAKPQGLRAYLPGAKDRNVDDDKLAGREGLQAQATASQEAELSGLSDYINQIAAKPSEINWSPIAAYLDSKNGSHYTASAQAMAGMNQDEKDKMIFGLKDKLLGGRAALAKENLAALQQQSAMLLSREKQDEMEKYHDGMLAAATARSEHMGGAIDSREKQAAQRQYLNDPINKIYKPRLDGAYKILELMDAGDKGDFKNTQPILGQLNAEIARLETGSQSPGLHSAEKTEMLDAKAALINARDTLTGAVSDVDLRAKFAQARGMVNDLAHTYKKQIQRRHEELRAGATDNQLGVFDAKIGAYDKSIEEQESRLNLGAAGNKRRGGPSAGKPETVVQNGHTYHLNFQTGEYE